jgi:hypothetical protein
MKEILVAVFAVIGMAIGFVALLVGFGLLIAWPFMWMWNYAVVAAFPTVAAPITYWVAYWLMIFLGCFVKASTTVSTK